MNSQFTKCYHTEQEEKYICLNTACVKGQELKLDCLSCLQKTHPHDDCILHIDQIISDAKTNEQSIRDWIEKNYNQMEELLQKLNDQVYNIQETFNQWIQAYKEKSVGEIKQFQKYLEQHSELLTYQEGNLAEIIKLKTYNFKTYNLWGQQSNDKLNLNFNQLEHQFDKFLLQLSKICQVNLIEKVPKFEEQYNYPQTIEYQQCHELGCANINKTQLCLQKDCLENFHENLECPSCLTNRHFDDNCYKEHRKYVINGTNLWVKQKQYISDVRSFQVQKNKQIDQSIQEFEKVLSSYLQSTEEKLIEFQGYMLKKQQAIQTNLQEQMYINSRFNSKFQIDQFVIYKDLLLERDYSKLAGITELDREIREITFSFKTQFEDMDKKDFKEIWNIQETNEIISDQVEECLPQIQ